MKMHSLALICVAVLSFAACGRDSTGSGGAGGTAGSGGSGGAGGSGGTGGSGGGMVTTIKALRMNPPGIGVTVTFNNVVVVQRVDSSKHGDIWVQDMGGGAYSGIHVYCNYGSTTSPCQTSRTSIQTILRGQVVNITGVYQPYTPTTPTGSPTQLEINNPAITNTGMMATPMAMNVTAADVAKDATLANTAQYQGSYVKVTDGPFMISDVMPVTFQGACPAADANGNTWFGVEATGSGKTLEIGLTFHTSSTNTTSLTWCSGACFMCPTAMELSGHTFSTVSGIAEPDSNSSTNAIFFKVMPTVDTDLPM
jgi:hypothetical protein